MRSEWCALGSIAIGLFAAARASAEPMPVRVGYAAAVGCPAQATFEQQLFSRSVLLRAALPGEPALEVGLSVTASGGRYSGTLHFRELNGRVTERAVPGSRCEQVVSALALVAAVLADPETERSTPESEPTLVSTPAPAPVGKPELAPRPTPRRSTPSPRRRAPRSVPPPKKRPEPEADTRVATSSAQAPAGLRWFVGAGALLQGAVATETAPGLSLELGIGLETRSAIDPLLLLSFNRVRSQTVTTSAGVAELTWTAARLGLCPLRWPPSASMSLRLCGAFDAGWLEGRGADTADAADAAPPWWAAGGFARLEARVAPRVAAVLDGGVLFPFRRDRFYFEPDRPDSTAFKVPMAGGFGRLGVSFGLN